MNQMIFIHGPGAGGCGESFVHQLKHYPGSLAPTLPGHLEGKPCANVERYTEWLRGWLWSQGKRQDLVLVGFTLGACIALEYGLDYPDEVKALVLMTVAMRPKERPRNALEIRLDKHHVMAHEVEPFLMSRRVLCGIEPQLQSTARPLLGPHGHGHEYQRFHLIGIVQAVLEGDARAQGKTHQH